MAYSSITKPSLHFNTKLYSGDSSPSGSGTQSVTGVGFQPDWTWLKSRSAGFNHRLFDAVRGVGKNLVSNLTDAEQTVDEGVTAFNSDGFSVKQGGNLEYNNNNHTYVSWNWKANGQGSSNTDGSINTTYTSVNTTAGFSICYWSGTGANATIGHGLGAVPKIIITKSMASVTSWCVYHASLGNTKTIFLESDGSGNTHIAYYNNTSPTSSVFTVGTDSGVNHSGNNMIAYCFAEKTGYSKFGTYAGNGDVLGPFVYTGFKPAFIIIKNFQQNDSWQMYDNKRLGYNVDNNTLHPDLTNAESTSDDLDILSNGFKIRRNVGVINNSNASYIFMAFAENPLVANVGASGVPATAK